MDIVLLFQLSKKSLFVTAALVPMMAASFPSLANGPSGELQDLRSLLQDQQKQIEAQSQQLREQEARYEMLLNRVDSIQQNATIGELELDLLRGTSPGVRHGNATGDKAASNEKPKQVKKAKKKKKSKDKVKASGNKNSTTVKPNKQPVKNKPVAKNTNKDLPQTVGDDRKPAEPERPPEIAAYIEEGGVLLRRGSLVVTPEVGYLNSSATRVAIEGFSVIPALNIGLFEISELSRNTLRTAIGMRYGVTNRFEIEAKVPFIYREDSTRNRPIGVGTSSDVLNRVDGSGIGDVEIGAHYQLTRGRDGWPYFVGNLRFKSDTGTSPFDVATDPATGLQTELPTGSGFMALQPSITAIYPTDPGVIYGNLGYLTNLSKDISGTGEISPGDSVSASLGMSIALNDRSSLSVGYAHNTVFKTRLNDQIIPNSRNLQVGTIDFGYSHRLSKSTSVNLNVSAGITDDAPDSNVVLRVPMKFNLLD